MMEELNEENIDILKTKKYLKEDWPNKKGFSSRIKCEYKNKGNLTDDGLIYCVYHGDYPTNIKGDKIPPSNEYLELLKKEEREQTIKKYCFYLYWVGIIFCMYSNYFYLIFLFAVILFFISISTPNLNHNYRLQQ